VVSFRYNTRLRNSLTMVPLLISRSTHSSTHILGISRGISSFVSSTLVNKKKRECLSLNPFLAVQDTGIFFVEHYGSPRSTYLSHVHCTRMYIARNLRRQMPGYNIQYIPGNLEFEVQIVLPSISSKHSQVRPHASHECVHAQNAKYSSFRSRNLAAYQTFYFLNAYSEKDRIQASKATAMLVGGAPLP